MNNEKNYLIKILEEASKGTLKNRLDFFSKYDKKPLQRWENWFQMELLYLLVHSGVKDAWFEDRYSHDKRTKLPYSKLGFAQASIDIVYRRPNTISHLYTGIELKVQNHPEHSIKGSLVDLLRIGSIVSSEWAFRAIFSISIYLHETSSKYIALAREMEGDIINIGPYKAAIIGWEASSASEATLDSYKQWLALLKQEFKKKKINLI